MDMSFGLSTIQGGRSRETSNWRQVWESSRVRKVEIHKNKKIHFLRAKSKRVRLCQSNWEEVTRYWHQVSWRGERDRKKIDSAVDRQSRRPEEKPQIPGEEGDRGPKGRSFPGAPESSWRWGRDADIISERSSIPEDEGSETTGTGPLYQEAN